MLLCVEPGALAGSVRLEPGGSRAPPPPPRRALRMPACLRDTKRLLLRCVYPKEPQEAAGSHHPRRTGLTSCPVSCFALYREAPQVTGQGAKGVQVGRRRQDCPVTDGTVVCTENPKESGKKHFKNEVCLVKSWKRSPYRNQPLLSTYK